VTASADNSAAEKLKAAVQARLALRSRHKIAASSDDDESFGAKLKRAIAARRFRSSRQSNNKSQ